MVAGGGANNPIPIMTSDLDVTGKEGFMDKEVKFAKRWLTSKGVILQEEQKNPVDTELESFFDCCRTGKTPIANLEVGMADSVAVMLSNLAMDEGRKVYFNEIDKMGRPGAPTPPPPVKKEVSPEHKYCDPTAVAPVRSRGSVDILEPIDQAGNVSCAETVIDIDHGDVAGTAIQHAEQRGKPVKAGPITHAGGNGDDGTGDQAADHTGQGAFHAGADHYHPRLCQALAIVHQAVNSGDADIVDGVHIIAHQLRRDLRFLRYGDVAGAGTDHGNSALAVNGVVAPEANGAGERQVLRIGHPGGDHGGAFAIGARNQDVTGVSYQALRDGHHLFRSLTFGEDDLWHAMTKGAMVVDLGEAEVFKGHMAHAAHGCLDIHCAGAHLFKQRAQLVLIHEARISEWPEEAILGK